MIIPKTEEEAVKQFTPFVFKTAKYFTKYGTLQEDLVQAGLLAVALAFRQWDPKGGASMLTWIRRPVRNVMTKMVREHKRKGGTGTGETRKEDPTDGVAIMSLDQEFVRDNHEPYTLHDVLGTFDEPPDYLALRQLPAAMLALTPKERTVIRLRFERDWTLAKIGRKMALSRERIRQIERDALTKLRRRVSDKGVPS